MCGLLMMFTVMLGGARSRRLSRRRSRGRGRVRCEDAGLSDKADDGSQKQNVFYHRWLSEHREEREVSKKIATLAIATLAKERACWSTNRSRAMILDRYSECAKQPLELLSLCRMWMAGLLITPSGCSYRLTGSVFIGDIRVGCCMPVSSFSEWCRPDPESASWVLEHLDFDRVSLNPRPGGVIIRGLFVLWLASVG